MIIKETEYTMKNGRQVLIRSPREEDIQGILDYLYQTACETEFLLRYPEECSQYTPESEKAYLENFLRTTALSNAEYWLGTNDKPLYYSFEQAANNELYIRGSRVTYSEEEDHPETGEITFHGQRQWTMVTGVTITYQQGRPADFNFVNEYRVNEADVNLKKIDEKQGLLSGVVFDLRVKVSNSYQPVTQVTEPVDYSGILFNSGKTGAEDTQLQQVTISTSTYSAAFTTPEYSETELTGNPLMTIKNLPDGEYQLVEVKAPDGYVMTLKPIDFTVENGVLTYSDSTNNTANGTKVAYVGADDDTLALLTVKNEPGAALPSTGGTGIRFFTILGSILIAGAGLLLWRRRSTI